ncbi:hypothetical protein [Methanopyrus sp.]
MTSLLYEEDVMDAEMASLLYFGKDTVFHLLGVLYIGMLTFLASYDVRRASDGVVLAIRAGGPAIVQDGRGTPGDRSEINMVFAS